MSISATCPKCSAKLTAPDAAAGKRVKCPKCAQPVPVPAPKFEVVEEVEEVEESEGARPQPPKTAPAKLTKPAKPARDESEDAPRPKKRPARVEEEGEDEDPRPKKKRKGAAKSGPPIGLLIGVAAVLLLGGAATAVFLFTSREKPKETVNTPAPPPEPASLPAPVKAPPPPGWTVVTPDGSGLRVALPPGMIEDRGTSERAVAAGAVSAKMFRSPESGFGGSPSGVICGVGRLTLPRGVPDAEKRKRGFQFFGGEDVVNTPGAQSRRQSTTLGGQPAEEVSLTIPARGSNPEEVWVIRSAVFGDDVVLMGIWRQRLRPEPNVESGFFDSLVVTGPTTWGGAVTTPNPPVTPLPPEVPPVPAGADPYDYDWRSGTYDDRRAALDKKADEAQAELEAAGVQVRRFDVSLFAKHLTADGKIDPAVLKNLRLVGATKLSVNGALLNDAALREIGQLRCLKEIVAFGGGKYTDAGLAGLVPLKSLQEVNIGGTERERLAITGEGFRHLAALPRFRVLDVRRATVTDAALAHLAPLTTLESIDFEDNRITDAGLTHLAALPRLSNLNLTANAITGTGCQGLTRVKWLMLDDCPVSDAGAAAIAKLGVEELFLYGSKVTDTGAAALAKMGTLKLLRLSETGITDAALKSLAVLPNLEELHVRDTKVTDDGLLPLVAAPKLKQIDVSKGGAVTPAGIEKLKKAKPGLKVGVYS